MAEKIKIRRKLIIEGVIATIIAISPLIHYWWKYLPGDVDTISFLGAKFTSNGFVSLQDAFYYYFLKITPLLLMIIWFVTCKQWWYHAILIPIAMYSFQLFSVITFQSNIIDENEILYIVAVTIIVIPIVYFIRIKLVDKYIHGIDLKAMDTELQILKAKQELREEREKLEKAKKRLSEKV